MGENLSFQEEYFFWRLAHYLISAHEYRIVQLSQEHNELWLEKMENKKAQVIRLLRHNLDWSNWMQRDIEHTAMNGERIRKQLVRKEMNVINVYVTAYPPVDDYEFRIEQPFVQPDNGKTKVDTIILARTLYEKGFKQLGDILHDSISFPIKDSYEESEIEAIKLAALSEASSKVKKEQNLFNYGKPFFTYMFIIIQVAMFLLLEWKGGSTDNATLIKYGAKYNPLILEGEWWRFFTPMILHIGIIHLLMNSLALYYLGTAVERIYGNLRFLFIYLFAGFSGVVASFIFSPSVSAGASGAIYGCFGALLYLGVIYPKLFFRTIGINILVVLGINLIFGFTMPGVDYVGHIGGLIGGFLATGIVHFPKQKKYLLQSISLFISAVAITGLLKYGFSESARTVHENSALIGAQTYIQTEEFDRVEDLLSDYVNDGAASAEVYLMLAYAELKTDEITKAKDHLYEAMDKKKDFHEAYYYLAVILLNEGNIQEAKKYAVMANEIMPNQSHYEELLTIIDKNSKD